MFGQKYYLVLLKRKVWSKVIFSASEIKCSVLRRNVRSKVISSAFETKCSVKSAFKVLLDEMLGQKCF